MWKLIKNLIGPGFRKFHIAIGQVIIYYLVGEKKYVFSTHGDNRDLKNEKACIRFC